MANSPKIPIPHRHLTSTDSTNSQLIDEILASIKNGKIDKNYSHSTNPHFSQAFLLTAETQTNGRGQHGRQWQSPVGNVYLSLYIPTAEFAEDKNVALKQRLDGRLSLCVGYQLSQIAEIKSLQKIGVKWVNDIGFYTHNVPDGSTSSPRTQTLMFNKLAGILIEPVSLDNKLLGVVVGVGMNVQSTPDLTQPLVAMTIQKSLSNLPKNPLPYHAISLADLSPQFSQSFDLFNLYQDIQKAILQAVQRFNGFEKLENVTKFIQDFASVDTLLGKQIFISQGETLLQGTACGIDSNGCLQILQADGTMQAIWTGAVRVLE